MRCDAGDPPMAPARPPAPLKKITVENGLGMSMELATFGATLLSLKLDGDEMVVRIDQEQLPCRYGTYGGNTIGRFANRIAKGKFKLNGENYTLEANNGPNSLHGGVFGFHRRAWEVAETIETANEVGVEMNYLAADGEEGFPGKLLASARYTLCCKTNELRTLFKAELVDGEELSTIINMCNHVYWNLSGKPCHKIMDHTLELNCPSYIPVDDTLIPIGEIASVKDTPFEFRNKPYRIGDRMKEISEGENYGYDHCISFLSPDDEETESEVSTITRNLGAGYENMEIKVLGTLADPNCSGRRMTMSTTQPGVQVYTGNYMPDEHQHTGVALETEHFPDTINQRAKNDRFPTVTLQPGEKYAQATIYTFEA